MKFADKSLAQIVTEFPSAVAILEKHDLDYCCKGKQALSSACQSTEKLEMLEQELDALISTQASKNEFINFKALSSKDLVDHILLKHHKYVKEAIPLIDAYLHKVSSKHGERHPELFEIKKIFSEVCDEMLSHMAKEEKILFPAIKHIQGLLADGLPIPGVVQLKGPIEVMEMEHEQVGSLLAEIRKLTNKYSPPADACMTYKLSFEELRELEEDLHKHVHLENNILFPRVREYMQVTTTLV